MTEQLGLRERKKRRTRQAISDMATRMFIQRGFEHVTVAEVAEAADVSVNTVFNYFPTKEDLFFDRQEEVAERLARAVRDRSVGESAVAAVRRQHLDWLARGDYRSGLHAGAAAFARTIHESPALWTRMVQILTRTEQYLARALAEETQAAPGDITPDIVAGQLAGVTRTLQVEANRRLSAGETVDDIRPDIIAAAERAYALVESGVGDYCTKASRSSGSP